MIRSFLTFALLLSTCVTALADTPYYTVKFPDDYTVYGCGADPGITYPYITGNYNCNFNVGVSYNDQVFYTNDTEGCSKILRTWTLIYWCDYNPNWPSPTVISNPPNSDVGPTVQANSYNHGYLRYTQIIKVIDDEKPYFLDCPTGTLSFCDYTNNDPNQYHNGSIDLCEGTPDLRVKVTDDCSQTDIKLTYRLFLDLDGNGSMETYVSSSSPGAWPIETTIDGGLLCGQVKFPPGFGLPYGKHKIEWIADDNCGNEAICKYEFTIDDCKPPSITCYNGLSANIMVTGMITLWDTDFIKEYSDNCSPNNKIRLGIRKAGQGTGFPNDQHSVTFTCDELGKQYVEVWANDESGAADYCITFVDVQDNIGACPPSNHFKGIVATDQSVLVPDVQVKLMKFSNLLLTVGTDQQGQFAIPPQTAGCNYKIIPSYNGGSAKLGVNTLDALLVAGQIDNLYAITSPYKLIAADVNKDGKITSADVMSITKVGIGAQSDFTGVNSWQFVPQSHNFSNPLNPWAAAIPSSLNICLSGPISFDPDFVAIKTGDVNSSANPADFASDAADRTDGSLAVFQTNEQVFTSGQEVRVDITTPDLASLAAFQFTLDFDPAKLSLVSIEPGLVTTDFMAQLPENRVTASWHNAAMLDLNVQGKNIRARTLTLVFNSLEKGVLSESLKMTSEVANAEVYTRSLQTVGATLEYLIVPVSKTGPSFLSVRPNPVSDRFTAAFYLPEAGETTLRLTDATGRVLQTVQANRDSGYNETEFEIPGAEPGLLFLRLDGPGGSDLQKVMKF